MKCRIYKVPFYIITRNVEDYFCKKIGFVVVRKNNFGTNKEIISGFSDFCELDIIEYDSYAMFLAREGKINNKIDYNRIIGQNTFAIALETLDFTNKKLATLKDIEEWEQNFETSEFYKYYQQMHIFDKDEKKAIRDKVKSISKRRLDGKF